MALRNQLTRCLLILLFTTVGSVNALDGKRAGFTISFGVGVGSLSWSEDQGINEPSLAGFQTTFEIGGGLSEQLLILYSGHTAIFKDDYETIVWATPTTVVRYYFQPITQSPYLFGGPALAVAASGNGDGGGGLGFGGLGLVIGGGYQFSRSVQLQLEGVFTTNGGATFRAIDATINFVGF